MFIVVIYSLLNLLKMFRIFCIHLLLSSNYLCGSYYTHCFFLFSPLWSTYLCCSNPHNTLNGSWSLPLHTCSLVHASFENDDFRRVGGMGFVLLFHRMLMLDIYATLTNQNRCNVPVANVCLSVY